MIWEEAVRGGFADGSLFGLSGREQMEAGLKRGGPAPPIAHLTGMTFDEIGDGTATFSLPVSEWLLTGTGVVPGGVIAMVADAALGCAIYAVLPPATPYTTAEISLTFLRPATLQAEKIVCNGTLIHAGKSVALSQVEITDAHGRLLGHGTSRCHVFPQITPVPDPPGELEPFPQPKYATPDPWQRPLEGEVLDPEKFKGMSGLEIAHAFIKEELPAPPICHLTGTRVLEVEEGRSVCSMPTTAWLASPTGLLQGGAITLVAETAMLFAIQSTVPAGGKYALVDLKANFLRPVPPDGTELIAKGTVVHRGKSLAIAEAEVLNAEGKTVLLTTGSAALR
jgi:uncharacterized protein (TIGR00369 family)